MELAQSLPVAATTAGVARRSLKVLEGTLPEDRLHDLQVVVSELVTNAVVHGLTVEGYIHLTVQVMPGRIRVEVTNAGGAFTRVDFPVRRNGARRSGYGLLIVDRLAQRWGVVHDLDTTVWAELALPNSDRPVRNEAAVNQSRTGGRICP
jgi:anti-sigma regulatory factor (Ser/Thr protein kinase)